MNVTTFVPSTVLKRILFIVLPSLYCINLCAEALSVARITPSGDAITRTESIVIEFNQDVVALGDSLFNVEDVPITIEPAVQCEWSWVKRDALACNLSSDSALKLATEYTVTINPGITTEAGATLAEPFVHTFRTKLPTVRSIRVVAWALPTMPIFRVDFDQPVRPRSMVGKLELRDQAGETVATRVWPHTYAQERILQTEYFGVDRVSTYQKPGATRSWFVFPTFALDGGREFALVQLPGVQATAGNLTHEEEIIYPQVARTFSEFRFLGINCFDLGSNELTSVTDVSEIVSVSCAPDRSIALLFSVPIEQETMDTSVMSNPSLTRSFPRPAWSRNPYWHFRELESTQQVAYNIPVPLQPNTTYELRFGEIDEAVESGMSPFQDVFGREIQGIKRIKLQTGHYRPQIDIEKWFTVVEADAPTTIPLFSRNVDALRMEFTSLDQRGIHENQVRTLKVPKDDNAVLIQDLGLRKFLNGSSGAMLGLIHATPRFEVREELMQIKFFAQATPYQVYVKESAINTLVWVTDIRSGQSVKGARVELYTGLPKDFAKVPPNAYVATTDESGLAKLAGHRVYNLDQEIDGFWMDFGCVEPDCRVVLVTVTGERGIAVVPLISSFRLEIPSDSNEKRRISNWYYGDNTRINAWGTTAQGVYHKGDSVSFKGYVRDWSDTHLQLPPNGKYSLLVKGPRWDVVYSKDAIELNEFGAFEGKFRLSKAAIMGRYRFELSYEEPNTLALEREDHSRPLRRVSTEMQFFVSDFTPNPIRVSHVIHGEEFQYNDSLLFTTTSEFHAGGAYADANSRGTVWIQPRSISFDNELATEFWFNHSTRVSRETLLDRRTNLDKEGSRKTSIPRLRSNVYYGTLTVESAVQSDRGKYVTTRSSVPYRGVDRYIGLRSPNHRILQSGIPSSIESLVVSKDGIPQAGAPFEIKMFKRVLTLARVQSGVAPTQFNRLYHSRWELVHECNGSSTVELAVCTFTPQTPGGYRAEASVQDANGNVHKADLRLWVTGKEFVLWEEDPDDSDNFLQMSCIDSELQVGERVRCVVQNPLVNSPALITVERNGVIDQFVRWFQSSTPVVEFEVKSEYMPGFFLSVIVASPRVGDSHPDLSEPDWVDLGIPSYRVGYASFDVVDPERDLTVKVSSNRAKYAPRDQVSLNITTDRSDRRSLPVEYAVIVLDEAVFDLIESRSAYFDPSDAFDQYGDLEVKNYSLIRNLIGFRTQEKLEEDMEEVITTGTRLLKGETEFGGGGLTDEIRMIDKLVAYWNPSVVAKKGRSKLSFELPDNLTSWRVLVLATSTDSRFGFAQTSFVATKDTEIRPIVPNVVSENDTFDVGVSILNRTKRERTLDVELVATGLLAGTENSVLTQSVTLAPFERKTVTHLLQAGLLQLSAHRSVGHEKISLIARARDRFDRDDFSVDIPVRSSRVKVTSVDYGILADRMTRIPFKAPELPPSTSGAVRINLSTQDLGSLNGIFDYARSYPYLCWEQMIFKAVMALQSKNLQNQSESLVASWTDTDEEITSVLESASDFQAPNGGMTFFVPSNEYVNAYLSAFTALAFTWFEESGYEVDSTVVARLHEYLQEVLRDSESFALGSSQARATIRAVALHALSTSDAFSHTDLTRYTSEVKNMSLFGLAHLLIAATNVDNAETTAELAFESIMNQRSLVDGSVEFVESLPTIYNFILTSRTRSNCTVLEALTRYSQLVPDGVVRDELFPLVQSIMSFRGDRSRWSNTQENVYCVNALLTYSRYFDDDTEIFASINLENSDGSKVNLASRLRLGKTVKNHSTEYSLASTLTESRGTLAIEREGKGNGFYTVELSYLASMDNDLNRLSGFELDREYLVKRDGEWHRLAHGDSVVQGEIINVNLFLKVPATRYYVVVDDTVPGGLEPVNRLLATDSIVDLAAENRLSPKSAWFQEFEHASGDPWPFYHTDKGHANVRFFSERVRPGKYRVSWVGQAITTGEFRVVPAHVEEMYRPEVFGKSTSRVLQINP